MKTFKIGDWVEITPQTDNNWDYWKNKHEMMKGTFGEIERVEPSKDKQHIFYYVRDLEGRATWFLDRHLILTQRQDRRFIDNMRQACEKLQEHERVCKKLLHEMLDDVFGEEKREEPLLGEEEQEEFFEDWEEEDTAEYITLPAGGIMVNPNYDNGIKKTKSNKRKKKTRIRKKMKTKSKKKTNAKQNNANSGKIDTNSMDPADWMTDEELEAYLDDMYGIDWT